MDFDTWLQQKGHTGFLPDAVARKLYDDFVKENTPAAVQKAKLSDGSVVDVVNGQVVRDARPKFETFVDDKGFKSRLNLDTGLVERVTNATGQPVKQSTKTPEVSMFELMQMTPEQKQIYFDRLARGEDPTAAPAATPSPTPEAAMTNSMAFQGVPARAAYETNMPTGVAAPALSGAMGGGQGITMTPAPASAAPTNAPAAAPSSPEEIRAAYQRKQISKDEAIRLLRGGS